MRRGKKKENKEIKEAIKKGTRTKKNFSSCGHYLLSSSTAMRERWKRSREGCVRWGGGDSQRGSHRRAKAL